MFNDIYIYIYIYILTTSLLSLEVDKRNLILYPRLIIVYVKRSSVNMVEQPLNKERDGCSHQTYGYQCFL